MYKILFMYSVRPTRSMISGEAYIFKPINIFYLLLSLSNVHLNMPPRVYIRPSSLSNDPWWQHLWSTDLDTRSVSNRREDPPSSYRENPSNYRDQHQDHYARDQPSSYRDQPPRHQGRTLGILELVCAINSASTPITPALGIPTPAPIISPTNLLTEETKPKHQRSTSKSAKKEKEAASREAAALNISPQGLPIPPDEQLPAKRVGRKSDKNV